jgi:poly(A) polymerase
VEEDVLRRDFTLNALLYDPQEQLVVDYLGGMKDIAAKRIKPIIPLSRIFTDDPVRMIRAVKYAAATGFTLPFSLKREIRRQPGLLASVSPSRLTEEIFKIIHASSAAAIVEKLDDLGLYRYLQPRAVELFSARRGFREQYLATLGNLSGEGFKNLPGEALSGLVRDYLEDAADWDGMEGEETPRPPSERYREAFLLARTFVLPMNPPRMELDHAVRLLFAERGINIKKTRFNERGPRLAGEERALESGLPGEEGSPEKAHRKRRRKKRSSHQNHPEGED